MLGSIQAKLSQIVSVNQLQRFYPPQALQALASRLDSRVNFRELASRWGMPVELALDLAALALYDIVIVADGELENLGYKDQIKTSPYTKKTAEGTMGCRHSTNTTHHCCVVKHARKPVCCSYVPGTSTCLAVGPS
jgi:hypothetical protein